MDTSCNKVLDTSCNYLMDISCNNLMDISCNSIKANYCIKCNKLLTDSIFFYGELCMCPLRLEMYDEFTGYIDCSFIEYFMADAGPTGPRWSGYGGWGGHGHGRGHGHGWGRGDGWGRR